MRRWMPLLLMVPASLAGQEREDVAAAVGNVPEEVLNLVVAIRSYQPGRMLPQFGAGVVLGLDDQSVYIATARHVVEGADRIWAVSAAAREDSASARVVAVPEVGTLDLAVIAVDRGAFPAGFQPVVDRLGDPSRLSSGDPVTPVGCPDEVCWSAPALPDRVLAASPVDVLFQSDFVKRGSSGGALFDRWWELVGLVTTSDPPRAGAIPIDYVVEQAATWGIPVSVRRPSIPRGGYRTTVGAAILFPTASASERFPSGRLDLTYEARYPLSVHISFLRLAPGALTGCPPVPGAPGAPTDTLLLVRAPCEVVLNSFLAGLGLNLNWRRVTVRAMGDAGLGIVQGRFDQAGVFFETPDLQYVPNFKGTDEHATFVVGLGIILDFTVMSRTILQARTGYWIYDDDPFAGETLFPAEFTPDVPHFFFGFGLKLGL